jgi:hypothetical protein
VRQEDLNFTVPDELIKRLPEANKAGISITELKQDKFTFVESSGPPDGVIEISRPAISKDGLAAVVAIAHLTWGDGNGSSGYTAYLEKKDGRWVVIGYSNVWTV